jgi:hypothetical protein
MMLSQRISVGEASIDVRIEIRRRTKRTKDILMKLDDVSF